MLRQFFLIAVLFTWGLFAEDHPLLIAIENNQTELAFSLTEEIENETLDDIRQTPERSTISRTWIVQIHNQHYMGPSTRYAPVKVFGLNALELAIVKDNIEIVQMLLDHGADPFARRRSYTIIWDGYAYIAKHNKFYENTPLSLAIEKNNEEIVTLLINRKKDLGEIAFKTGIIKNTTKSEKNVIQYAQNDDMMQAILHGFSDHLSADEKALIIEAGAEGDLILWTLEKDNLAIADHFFSVGQIYHARYLDAALNRPGSDFIEYLLMKQFVTLDEVASRAIELNSEAYAMHFLEMTEPSGKFLDVSLKAQGLDFITFLIERGDVTQEEATLRAIKLSVNDKAKLFWQDSFETSLETAVSSKNKNMVDFLILEKANLGKAFELAFNQRWGEVVQKLYEGYEVNLEKFKEEQPLVLEEMAETKNYAMAKFLVAHDFPLGNAAKIAYQKKDDKMLKILLG
jgi:ankyrin repeat protein